MHTLALILLFGAVVHGHILREEDRFKWGDYQFLTEPLTSHTTETEQSRNLVAFTASEYPIPEIIKVTDNVHVATGFALANSIMIEGDDGIIIVDTTEVPESMIEIMVEFRKITDKPVKAIISTHFHLDHISGTNYIIESQKETHPDITIEVYAHELTQEFMNQWAETYDVGFTRGVRQVGPFLPTTPRTGAGIGPLVRVNQDVKFNIPKITITVKERASYSVAGINFDLIFAPGETNDQLCVWLPDLRMALPGDNIYKMFPNIYAIRGSPTRDARQWYRSIDKIRDLGAEYLVPSHTRPVHGAEAIDDILTVYRDGIKYVHDQTVRLLDKGTLPGEIVEKVKLPNSLAAHPYMQEYYGTVAWSVRGIFDHYLGWFSGDPVDLDPMPAQDRADRVLALVDAVRWRIGTRSDSEVLLIEAQKAHQRSYDNYVETGKFIGSDDKWALEIANTVLRIETEDSRIIDAAKVIQISALTSLGVASVSPNGRNYYLTYALEKKTGLQLKRSYEATAYVIQTSEIDAILKTFCLGSTGTVCQQFNYTVAYEFTDLGSKYGVTLRNSVCDVITGDVDSGETTPLSMKLTSQVFRDLMSEATTITDAVNTGSVTFNEGTVSTYSAFMSCFDSMVGL